MTDLEKDLLEHYKAISEIYIATYEQSMEREFKIMKAKGVVCEMYSDLFKFLDKNPKSEKGNAQLARLKIFDDVLEVFGSLSSTNVQIKMILNKKQKELSALELENKNLNQIIINLNKFISETSK